MAPSAGDDSPEPPPLSEDETAFRASLALLVDWYRVSQWPMFLRAFLPAVFGFLPIGGTLIAIASSGHIVSAALSPYVISLGVLMVALGPAWCAYTLIQSIRGDAYVAIRVDGLALRLDANLPEELIAWEDIEETRYDPKARCAELVLRDREPRRIDARFTEVSLQELTLRIRDARRLAVWQRLVPRSTAQ